jgi:8-oxo-dGTP pyrophosphatase MutT (NUDIX family)/GNAT superfamily N-acetyltransferase
VELPQGLRLTVEDRPSAEDWDKLGNALDAYNRHYLGETDFNRIGLFVRNASGEIVAGLAASTYAGWLYVAELWVRADLRRRGIGSQLLALAERRAITLGCHSAMLDTFSFQGPGFYPRFGYQAYGTLDYPPDHQRIFLRKQLVPERSSSFSKLFPVSIKGVLFESERVVLLENERQEWELPGGRLEGGEEPMACLAREVAEELGAQVAVGTILDCWVYQVLPHREVMIVTYGLRGVENQRMRVSDEHRRFGLFALDELDGLPMPEGYRRSIRAWAALSGIR